MKKMIALGLVFVAAALVVACNQSSTTSTPVAPQSASFSASTERHNNSPVLLCHKAGKSDPGWIVIEVDNNSVKLKGHLRHGDFTTGTCSGLSGFEVGDDCSCCAHGTCNVH